MKFNIFILVSFFLFLFTACSLTTSDTNDEAHVENQNWRDVLLTDIRTGNHFKISDFEKPILIESFAVWCPLCTEQQNQVKELHKRLGDSFISIALNTDPNEDKEKVLNHINEHNFNWYYAISPPELTTELINTFGISFVNAPSAPMILICQNGSTTFLKRGVKSVDYLEQTISEVCNNG
jgi:thiol-disulfide isomerase/thioredoxin